MKRLIVLIIVLFAVPVWAITVPLTEPFVVKKPAVSVRMNTMTIKPTSIIVPLEYVDEDGFVVFKNDFRIINNPPIYSYNSSDEITGTLYPGDTDFTDIITYPIPQSYVGNTVYSPIIYLVKEYILNSLGVIEQ